MSHPIPIPADRAPTLPGKILLEEFLKPLGISQMRFAKAAGISYPRLSEIIHGKRGITADTAFRFARVLGTDPQTWLNLQMMTDLYVAMHSESAKTIARLQRLPETLSGAVTV